jgi:hypothetical protein
MILYQKFKPNVFLVLEMQKYFIYFFLKENILHSCLIKYPEFDNREYKFQVGSTERFLNICLWCEPRLDFDVSNVDKKCVLLGYVSDD